MRDDIVEADRRRLYASFNCGPVRWLTSGTSPAPAAPGRSAYRREPDLKPLAERDKLITEMGFDLDEQYVVDTYGAGQAARAGLALTLAGGAGAALPAVSFAEPATARVLNRADQQLVEWPIDGRRVAGARATQGRQALIAARETGDLALFRERMADVLAEDPDPEIVETIARAGFTARLLGRLRNE